MQFSASLLVFVMSRKLVFRIGYEKGANPFICHLFLVWVSGIP